MDWSVKRSKTLYIVLSVVLGIILLLLLALFVDASREQIGNAAESLAAWRWKIAPIRWIVYGLIVLFWSRLCKFIAELKNLDNETLAALLSMRGLVLRIMIAVEVLINLPTLTFFVDLLR